MQRSLLTAVGNRQHQLVSTWQLRLLEVSDPLLARNLEQRAWARVAPHVVSLAGPMTPIRRLAAAVLSRSCPEGAERRVEAAVETGLTRAEATVYAAMSVAPRVAGRSALWLHGVGPMPAKHWLRLPVKGPGSATGEGVIIRYGEPTGALHWLEGLPAVDVEQALMDIPGGKQHPSAMWLHHDLARTMTQVHAKRASTLDKLDERFSSPPRYVGAPALRRALADVRGELSHSATERAARQTIADVARGLGLVVHPRPFTVRDHGRILGEADVAIVALRLDLEVDGPHHLLPEQQRKDQLRDRRLRRARWEVERFPTELVDLHPQRFAAEVAECVRARLLVFPREIPIPG